MHQIYHQISIEEHPSTQVERFRTWCTISLQVALYRFLFDTLPTPNLETWCYALGLIPLASLTIRNLQKRTDGPQGNAYSIFLTVALLAIDCKGLGVPRLFCVRFAQNFFIVSQCEWFRLRLFHNVSPRIDAFCGPLDSDGEDQKPHRSLKGWLETFWRSPCRNSLLVWGFYLSHGWINKLLCALLRIWPDEDQPQCSYPNLGIDVLFELQDVTTLILGWMLMRPVRLLARLCLDRYTAWANKKLEAVDRNVDERAEGRIVNLGPFGLIQIVRVCASDSKSLYTDSSGQVGI